MPDGPRAFFEGDGDRRGVGDLASDQRPADARFEFALQEAFERARAIDGSRPSRAMNSRAGSQALWFRA